MYVWGEYTATLLDLQPKQKVAEMGNVFHNLLELSSASELTWFTYHVNEKSVNLMRCFFFKTSTFLKGKQKRFVRKSRHDGNLNQERGPSNFF